MTPEDAKNLLVKELGWPKDIVALGIRAKFCCEYFGKYLLENVDIYDSWQKDHIIPDGNNDPSNLAIACKTCNFVKRHTNPTKRAKGMDRDSLIQAAGEIIQERRKEKEKILEKTRMAAEIILSEN